MEHPDNLDKVGAERAIEDHVHGISNRCLMALIPAMPDMKARTPAASSLRSTVDRPCGSAAICRIAAVSKAR